MLVGQNHSHCLVCINFEVRMIFLFVVVVVVVVVVCVCEEMVIYRIGIVKLPSFVTKLIIML